MNARIGLLVVSFAITFQEAGVAAPPENDRKLELVIQTGHTRWVKSASFSPDGKRVVTASVDKTAILWDADTGVKLRSLTGHTDTVNSANFSPDGRRVVTASDDKTAVLWDADTGVKIRALEGHANWINSAGFSPDGKRVVTASRDKTAIIWDADTGEKQQALEGHASDVCSAGFSPDGKQVVTASMDETAILWNAANSMKLLHLKGHKSCVNFVSFSPDGKLIVTASMDETAVVWNAITGLKLRTIEHKNGVRRQNIDKLGTGVNSANFSPDGKQVVTVTDDKTAVIWDVATGVKLRSLEGHASDVESASFSPDGKRVVTASRDTTAIIWDADTGVKLRILEGHCAHRWFASFDPNGKQAVTASGGEKAILWNTESGVKMRTLEGHKNSISFASFSLDGKKIVTCSNDQDVIVWNGETGVRLRTLEGHEREVKYASFSPNGKRVVTASYDKTAIIWDADTGVKLRALEGHTNWINSAGFSPDGKRVVTASWDNKAIIWDVETGEKLRSLAQKGNVSSANFSPDGKRVVTASFDNTAIIWDADTGAKLWSLEKHTSHVNSAGFSPDGKRVVTASNDKTAVVWDADTGVKLHSLEGHTSDVNSANFIRDGKRVVTVSDDGTTRLWDAQTGQSLCSLLSLDAGKDWLVATPDHYFDVSENATKFVTYRIAGTNEFVPLERYRKQFERPGLLAKIFNGEDYRGANAVKQDLPPKVRITSPVARFETKTGRLTVEAEAVSQGEYPVHQFRLLVNGRPHTNKFGLIDIDEPKLGKATAKWDIELEPGKHTIEVLAYNLAVFGKSEAVEVKFVGGASGGFELPTLYVLAVGVSKYEKLPLDFAHRDAQEVAKAFQSHSKPLFKKIETKVLTDETATRANVLDGLDWLRKNMTQKDFGVFFFAGHGVKDGRGKVYFLPVDGDREKLTRTAIDGAVMADELTSTVGQLLVILDACHAGAVGGGNKTRGLSDELLKDLSSEEKGIAIMCSASGREEAGESREHRHGKFTVALLEGLRGKSEDKDNKIRLNDGAVYFNQLNGFVTDRVKTLSKGEQHPVTSVPRNFRDFPVTKP